MVTCEYSDVFCEVKVQSQTPAQREVQNEHGASMEIDLSKVALSRTKGGEFQECTLGYLLERSPAAPVVSNLVLERRMFREHRCSSLHVLLFEQIEGKSLS